MERLPILLLPGMDGTGILFRALRVALPPEVAAICEDLSPDRPQGHRELAAAVHPPDVPYAVLGESFSGPLALLLADRDPNARAVVLAASFARSPSRALATLWPFARSPLFLPPLPDRVVRRYLLGEDAGPLDLAAFRLANRFPDARTMAARVRAIARVNVEEELARCKVPILYLRARRDRLVGRDAAEQMRRVNPRVEIEDVDAPHLILQRAPEACARLIGEFLRRHGIIAQRAAAP
ncbi:MAG TPA: alpha/beta hydrolase [Myxococcales bacterium]